MIFGDSWLDFGLQEGILGIVRIIAAVGGAIVGWFVCDPVTRVCYRLSFKGATPGAVLLVTKFTGAATLSLLIYFFMPLGGGGAGLGWGPGLGGGPGKGPGNGGDKSNAANTDGANKDAKSIPPKEKTDPDKHEQKSLEPIEIEIISVKDYKDDDRFYLVKRTAPALSLSELEDYVKKEHAKIEVTPILTRDSFDVTQPDNPLSKLLTLTQEYKVKTLQAKKK